MACPGFVDPWAKTCGPVDLVDPLTHPRLGSTRDPRTRDPAGPSSSARPVTTSATVRPFSAASNESRSFIRRVAWSRRETRKVDAPSGEKREKTTPAPTWLGIGRFMQELLFLCLGAFFGRVPGFFLWVGLEGNQKETTHRVPPLLPPSPWRPSWPASHGLRRIGPGEQGLGGVFWSFFLFLVFYIYIYIYICFSWGGVLGCHGIR